MSDSETPDTDDVIRAIRADADEGQLASITEYLGRTLKTQHDTVAATYVASRRMGAGIESGHTIAQYRLVKELGRGGQAVVWLAEDTNLGRQVALKLIKATGVDGPDVVQRFRREAEITSRLDHPGICQVHEVGFDDVPWIAMRLVEGESLATNIASARTAQQDSATSATSTRELMTTVAVIEKAARALHAAHEAGVIHRDVKPGNIMLSADGEPVILDFGLAREEEGDSPNLTITGHLMGTPSYMSPEQLSAESITLDRRTDVYSLGVTLFECLTVQRPFDRPTRLALYQAILTEEAPDTRQLNRAIPKDLAVVVQTALQKNREHRYQTALELAEELRRVREYEPILARPVGSWTRTVRWAQRNPVIAFMLAVVIALLSVSTGVFGWQRTQVETKNKELGKAIASLDAKNTELEVQSEDLQDALGTVTAEKERVTRLKDRRILRDLHGRADKIFPSNPENLPALVSWLDDAQALLSRLPLHREAIAAHQSAAGPYTDDQKAIDHPETWAALMAARDHVARLNMQLDTASSPAEERALDKELTKVEDEGAELSQTMTRRMSWGFDTEDAWLHELLVDLVGALEDFESPDGTVADVTQRLLIARSIRARSIDDYSDAWKAVIERISQNDQYGQLAMTEQLGLIPLGPDPDSGLEEFLHWESHGTGAPQLTRDHDGRFHLEARTGMVFVLVPGATTRMGATRPASPESRGPHLDPNAARDEGPLHDVTLSPYFISKFEMTQAQWALLVGANPSQYSPGLEIGGKTTTWLHPVEKVSWDECRTTLYRVGLQLPTEAQWEHSARGGTSTIWSCGDEKSALDAYENVADAFGAANGLPASLAHDPDLKDGRTIHAPVGSYRPNNFGLHDVNGNVKEWCRDIYSGFDQNPAKGDGQRTSMGGARLRVIRGGSFYFPARYARVASRWKNASTVRGYDLGCRPSRVVTF